MNRLAWTLALATFTFGAVACDRSTPPAPEQAPSATAKAEGITGTVTVSGSSALQPLVNAAKEQFEAAHKGVSVEVSAGGSKKGLADVASGAVQIGDSDIEPAADQAKGLVDHKVAVVGFAAMANKGPFNEEIKSLTMDQLAKVFTGKITDWKDLGGKPQPITIINRAPASGTRAVFGHVVLGGDKFSESLTEDNSGALVTKLKQTKGSISYLALSFRDDALSTFAIKTDKGLVEPTSDAITSGTYPIWSYEHMYTRGEPQGVAKQFLDFIASPEFQEKTLPKVPGFIPVTRMKVTQQP